MNHKIYISVGSNIERHKNIDAGLEGMYQAFGELTISTVFESESVGFDGSHFFNLVVAANTTLSVDEVCKVLKHIEQLNGRVRGEKKFAPRTLDLDLLLYDDLVTNQGVELPREEICFNAFVLQPLAEIAENLMHPTKKVTIGELWRDYDTSKQQLWPISYTWSPTDK